jgi:hypothetical protein
MAVRASADGRFIFEIFTVSGEPRTLQFKSRHYSSPGDAERAGYARGVTAQPATKQRIRRGGIGCFGSPLSL